jgi:phosphoserine phosphatase
VQNFAISRKIRREDFLKEKRETLTTSQIEVIQWSAQQFERMVLDSAPKVAVFDCDGTIWGGDAGSGFLFWTMEQGLISRSSCDWIDTRYREYIAGRVSETEMCGEMVQVYAGLRDHELRAAAAQFVSEFIQQHIFPEIATLLNKLRDAGVELWAVSSTNRWVISEGVRDFGIPDNRVLAAEVRIADGVITGELVDVPTGSGKAAALRRVGLHVPDAVFGNSIHDLAMLEMARHPFPVNPSPALIAAAAHHGWKGYFRPRAAEGMPAAVAGE